jgi:superoxide dismutase, Cu-Zn family
LEYKENNNFFIQKRLMKTFYSIFLGMLLAGQSLYAAGDSSKPKKARAVLHPTKGNQAQGIVTFTEVEGGVLVVADIDFLEPGKHGFHIHEFGDCSAPDGSSAGGHFNPKKMKHGSPDAVERHVGDLGNIGADGRGYAHYERLDKLISLSGEDTIIGRSVVVHSNADDFTTQPTGNSGGRVACGVIEE